MPPADLPLELTIGGVAHCGISDSAFDTVYSFLNVVRLLASPGVPGARRNPSTQEYYHLETSTLLKAMTKDRDVPCFDAVLDLIRREPWCTGSGLGSGGWSVPGSYIGPGRSIRHFRSIRDIGDYWKIRESLMPRRAVRGERFDPLAVAEVFLPQQTADPSLEAHAARLLMKVFRQADGDISQWTNLHTYQQEQAITQPRLRGVLEMSERHGTIEFEKTGAGLRVRLTPTGAQRAEALLRASTSRAVRFDYTTSALVAAAMERYPNCVLDLGQFLRLPLSHFEGEPLSLDEILACARYLAEKRLVTVEPANGHPEALARLTSLGIECGLTDPVYVRKFMTDQPGFSIGTVYNYGGNNQFGTGNTMNIGADLKDLAEFAQKVLEAASTMDVAVAEREEIIGHAQELAAAAADPAPEAGLIRRTYEQLRSTLYQRAADAAVQGLLDQMPGISS
ncbi:hypothetical protein DRB96_19040 [Streptomyces sp. ICC1]|nr:hypothetical protein DRB89_18910 [Streptomyces sp. ICC4]AWZ14027.1 hypothetical protein DRB96_19040 [Streptomyces sp. ICC1]